MGLAINLQLGVFFLTCSSETLQKEGHTDLCLGRRHIKSSLTKTDE